MSSTVNPYANLNTQTVPVNPLNTASSGSNSTAQATSAQDIQNSFLTLLTAQLSAQDPLNPMDNSQMTSQMAQISQVSGIQQLNQSMQALVSAQAASQSLMATAMIGNNVLVAGNQMAVPAAGSTTQGGVMLTGPAAAVTVSVQDANGNVVRTMSVPKPAPGMNTFSWDGNDNTGKPVPADGTYTFSTQVTQASTGGATNATAYNNQKVNAVSWSQGVPLLVLSGGTSVPLANVAQMS